MSHISLSHNTTLSLEGRGGGGSVTGGGRIVFSSCVSPHKCNGTAHCIGWKSGPTFRPAAAEPTCSYLHRQQSESSFHKSPGRSALSAVSEHSQTAAVLGAHTLTLLQGNVYSWQITQKGGHHEGPRQGAFNRSLRFGPG